MNQSQDIFIKEQELLEQGEQFLADSVFASAEDRQRYGFLLSSYRTLLKQSRRIIKIADRTEGELNNLTIRLRANEKVLLEQSTALEIARDAAETQTAQIARLLNNSGQGFLSFGSDLVVAGRYSRACIQMLGRAPAGLPIDELLFPDDPNARSLLRDCVADALADDTTGLARDMYLSLIPGEVRLHDKTLEVQYVPVDDGVMVVMSDVSDERVLAERVARETSRLEMIVAAVTDGTDFFAAVEEFRAFAQRGADEWRQRSPADLHRTIHTFKGTFNQFGFHRLPAALHAAETTLRNSAAESADVVFAEDWQALLDSDLRTIADALGDDFVARRGVVTLDPERAVRFERFAATRLRAGGLSPEERAVLAELAAIRSVSFTESLLAYDRLIARVAARLEKEMAPLVVEGDDVQVDPDRFGPFLRSLGHVFRNAVDHGIEEPDSRVAVGKDAIGHIVCRVSRQDGGLILEIADDGGGIDEDGVRRRAALLFPSDARTRPLVDLIFADGLSSRSEATEVSGRGVGLAAVRQEVEKLGGTVWVDSRPRLGTTFHFRLSLGAPEVAG
jgi:two-component system chemotaxis sensor kinase CheA